MTDTVLATTSSLEAAPTPLAGATRGKIILYLSVFIVLIGFASPTGGLIGLPISFFLKNKLHLKAHEVAQFSLIVHIPVYLSFVFGFLRDTWNPFGRRDRGYLMLFGGLGAAGYLAFAFVQPTYASLMAAEMILLVALLFILSAQRGLISTIGQQHVMSGQLSAALNIFESLPGIAALLLGGALSNQLEGDNAAKVARTLFFTGAALMAAIAVYGALRPRSVFDNVHAERANLAPSLADLKRLATYWPVYPALLIWFAWNFAPGSVTSLQYFLQNTLHAQDAQWGQWNAIFSASFLPTFLLYGLVCRRFPLSKLLFWGTVAAIPQMIPLAFIHSVTGAFIAAVPMGLMGGFASAAYIDLLIRSCPPGLQGAAMMMSIGLVSLVTRFGDVLGTALYDRFGDFKVCVIAITVVYALILPMLLLVPKRLTATADGETAR